MRIKRGMAALALVACFAVPGGASAQSDDWGLWSFDLGINGGYAYFTAMLDDEHLGEDTEDVKFEAGWLLGGQATAWFSDRVGLRANLAYTERPLTLGNYDVLDTNDETTNIIEDVNIWHGTGDLMFRLGGGEGARFLPYLALGLGATWIRPPGTDTDDENDDVGVGFTTGGTTPQFYILERDTKLTGLVALGGDVRLSRGLGLRLEVGDRMFDAPLSQAILSAPGVVIRDDDGEDVGRVTHEVYGTIGLHLLMGVESPPPPVVVAPPPAPPAPAPPPAPREESVTVCVVDPSGQTGLRTVNAIYLPDSRDTVVVVNGNRVDLSSTTGNVIVASNADWFVQGQPLAISAGDSRMEYVSFGTSRLIDADDLTYLGTVRGLPVYGDRTQVGAAGAQLAQIRTSSGSNDLEVILKDRSALRTDLEGVEMLYVPLQPTGCVFQPLQRAQEVRKGK